MAKRGKVDHVADAVMDVLDNLSTAVPGEDIVEALMWVLGATIGAAPDDIRKALLDQAVTRLPQLVEDAAALADEDDDEQVPRVH